MALEVDMEDAATDDGLGYSIWVSLMLRFISLSVSICLDEKVVRWRACSKEVGLVLRGNVLGAFWDIEIE